MTSCLYCNKDLISRQTKFCSLHHNRKHNLEKYGGYEYTKKLRAASPRAYLSRLRAVKDRSEELSLDFLENLYFEQKGLCALSKEPMTYLQIGGNKKVPTNISIDRIDSNLGYTEINTQLVCHRVNIMKFDGTLEEMKLWCQKVLNA